MNYTLHLTDNCNLKCKYCYENKKNKDISFENIQLLIDREIAKKSKSTNLIFYGGEPLLKKDLIYNTINYIKSKKCETKFYFGMTTNGTLLDDEFIDYIKQNNFLTIGYSFDGKEDTQNLNRVTVGGEGTFKVVEENAKKLLKVYKNVIAMVVVTKNNINKLDENIEYLISLGFEQFNILFDYLEDWQDEDLDIIDKKYNKLADIYYNKILKEKDITISAFDAKIRTHVNKNFDCNKECNLGMKNINVGTDGKLYPCMQFVGIEKFVIGNCKDGIDDKARKKLLEITGKENESCKNCKINKRCKHTCSCKNYLTTGNINTLSPIVCELEKIVIKISDRIAEKLYKQNSKLFIQKYYNKNYGILKSIINNRKEKNK